MSTEQKAENRLIRYGMVGGGFNSWIGRVHRQCAAMDGKIQLVAGVFSQQHEKSLEFAKSLFIDPKRVYSTYQEMIKKEKELPENLRIDFVAIVTPNTLHFEISKAFIEAGFHVLCDKPMTQTLKEAEIIDALVKQKNVKFALTHNYSGYPLVKHARHLVKNGKLGTLRKVVVQYSQGWLTKSTESKTSITSSAGVSSLVDVGTHAFQLAYYITSLSLQQVCADVSTFVGEKREPDDFNILLRYKGGVVGVLIASQISTGEENDLRISVYGSEASIEWHQELPSILLFKPRGAPVQKMTTGNVYLSNAANANTRIPSGHPEGYIEAFANIYVNFGRSIITNSIHDDFDYPSTADGCQTLAFVEAVNESAKKNGWAEVSQKSN